MAKEKQCANQTQLPCIDFHSKSVFQGGCDVTSYRKERPHIKLFPDGWNFVES